MSASYVPGPGVALVAPGCTLLLARADDPMIERCWPLVRRAATIGEFVEALTSNGLSGLGDFALLRAGTDGGTTVALVRGMARILPSSADSPRPPVAAGNATTWVETEVTADAARLELAGEPSGPSRPVVEGVVSAAAVDMPLVASTGTAAMNPPLPSPPVEAPPAAVETTPPPVEAPAPIPIPIPTSSGPGTLIDATPWSADFTSNTDPGAIRSHPAAVDAEKPPTMAEPDAVAAAPARPKRLLQVGADPVRGRTGRDAGAARSGPPVHAVVCPYGHLSAPWATVCRVCNTPVAAQEPVLTARPLLGVLRLSTGDVVPLDRGVVLGRNPRPGDDDDPGRPHVVALPSPNKDISRSHVEVRLEDWTILVTDLGSTNGTTVAVPGHAPVRLRPHEPMPIEANTEVNLADEVVFRFEVTQ